MKRTKQQPKAVETIAPTKPAMTHQEQLEAILKSRRPEIVQMAKTHLDVWYCDVKLYG